MMGKQGRGSFSSDRAGGSTGAKKKKIVIKPFKVRAFDLGFMHDVLGAGSISIYLSYRITQTDAGWMPAVVRQTALSSLRPLF